MPGGKNTLNIVYYCDLFARTSSQSIRAIELKNSSTRNRISREIVQTTNISALKILTYYISRPTKLTREGERLMMHHGARERSSPHDSNYFGGVYRRKEISDKNKISMLRFTRHLVQSDYSRSSEKVKSHLSAWHASRNAS